MLLSGASFEISAAAARTSADGTHNHLLALCEALVSGVAELSPAAADGQLVARLDLAAGSFVVLVASQTLLSGSLRRLAAKLGTEQRTTVSAAAASQASVLHRCLVARLPLRGSTMVAALPLCKQADPHSWAAQLEASVAMDVAGRPRPQASYGFVPAISACAALAAPPPAPDRAQPFTVQASVSIALNNKIEHAAYGVLDCFGRQQLQAAGLALTSRRAVSSAGWLRPSTAPALVTTWRPIAMPPVPTPAKPAKWLIVSRRPTPLSAICTLPAPERATVQTVNLVYSTLVDKPPADTNVIIVASDTEAAAAIAASRADHIFCVCDGTASVEAGGIEAEIAAAAMLWAFRARASCSTSAKISFITFGKQTVGCDAAASTPKIAAAVGALTRQHSWWPVIQHDRTLKHRRLVACKDANRTWSLWRLVLQKLRARDLAAASRKTLPHYTRQRFCGLAGLARTLFMEDRMAYGTSVELPPAASQLLSVGQLQALTQHGSEYAIALRGGQLLSLRLQPAAEPLPRRVPASSEQTGYVTGGAKVRTQLICLQIRLQCLGYN